MIRHYTYIFDIFNINIETGLPEGKKISNSDSITREQKKVFKNYIVSEGKWKGASNESKPSYKSNM